MSEAMQVFSLAIWGILFLFIELAPTRWAYNVERLGKYSQALGRIPEALASLSRGRKQETAMLRSVILGAVAVVAMGAAGWAQESTDGLGVRTLFDGEDAAAFARVEARELTTVERTTAWASQGRASMRIAYQAWSPGKEQWPAAILHRDSGALPVTDFSAFRYLSFDLYNPGGTTVPVKLHLRDRAGKRFSQPFTVEAGETLACLVRIADMGVDVADIAEIHFYCTQPAEPFSICLDNLHLSAGLQRDLLELRDDLSRLQADAETARDGSGDTLPSTLAQRLEELTALDGAVEALSEALDGAPQDPARAQESVRQVREGIDHLRARLTAAAAAVPLLRAASHARVTGAAGFVLGVESSMVKVPLQTGLYSSPFSGTIRLALARNEHEHAQVVVVPFAQDLSHVRWRADELVGPGGATVPLQIRLVGYVDCGQPSYPVSRTGWWADPLIDFQSSVEAVPVGEVLPLWVSMETPADAVPGNYVGRLTVEADGLPEQHVDVEVQVWDFELPDHTSLKTALSWRVLSPRLYPEEQIPALTRDYENWMQSEYHLNAGNIYGDPPAWDVDRLRELRSMGLNAINLAYFNAPREPDFDEVAYWRRFDELVARIEAYMPTIEAAGVRDLCYIYCFDEQPSEQLDVVFETAARLKELWPDIEVMSTAYDSEFGLSRDNGTAVDIWVPLTPKFDSNATRLAEARAAGRDVWWYICIGPRNPYANWFVEYTAMEPRLIMGAMSARYRPGGFLYYAVNRWPLNDQVIVSGPKTCWNPASYRNNNGDGSIMCAGPDGPLATIRLENIRDGIEDYEYYVLLRALLARREEAGVLRKLGYGLQRLVGVGVSPGAGEVSEEVVRTLSDFSHDPEVLRAERRRVAEVILRLQD